MIDTTLIGVLTAAAVVVVLLLLFLRRQNAPKFELQDEDEAPQQLDKTSSAESLSTEEAQQRAEKHGRASTPTDPAGKHDGSARSAAPTDGDDAAASDERTRISSAPPSGQTSTQTSNDVATDQADTAAADQGPQDGPEADADLDEVERSDDESPQAEASSTQEESIGALKQGLKSTRGGFIARLAKLFKGKTKVDSALLDEFEEILITADVGVKTSDRLLQALKSKASDGGIESDDALWQALREEAKQILHVDAEPIALSHKPSLILVTGVNGVGKTTTIGKLAAKYTAEGRRVLLAAGDTYRAAAVLQLEVWGQRVGCPVIKGKEGADPGSVIFDAITRAREERYDLVIADTAGRLHTKQPLMEELKKVDRTITKALGGRAADEILLVLDATTGQNAVQQMHMFRDALNISGVVLTKLDGTAKGGVILGIVDEHKVPVRFVGLGERVEDLREFEADTFVAALFERPSGETLAA